MSDDQYWDDFNMDLCNYIQYGGPSIVDNKLLEDPKYAGKFFKNKVVVLPRGARKTTIGTIRYPMWKALKDPDLRCLLVFNTMTNAEEKLGKIKQEFEGDPRIFSVWPEVIPTNFRNSIWSGKRLQLNRKLISEDSTFECAGIGTAVTSRHFDLVAFDDPTSPEKGKQTAELLVPNVSDIELSIGRFKLLRFLQDNPQKAETLLCTTRWADSDIVDYVKNNYTTYGYFEKKLVIDGKPLLKRFPLDVVDQLRVDLGPYFFSCLCMNTPMEGALRDFKEEWLQEWHEGERFGDGGFCAVTIDPAMGKKRQEGCHTALVVAEHVEDRVIVRQTISEYLDVAATAVKAVDLAEDWGARVIGIEDVAYQMALAEPVKKELLKRGLDVRVKGIKVGQRSKDERIEALVPLFANGQVWFPDDDPYLRTQLLAFPFTPKRDLLDALALQKHFYRHGKTMEKITRGQTAVKSTSSHMDALIAGFAEEGRKKRDRISYSERFGFGLPAGRRSQRANTKSRFTSVF